MCGCVTVFVTYVAHSCGALGQRSPGLPWFFKGLRRGRVGMAFACLSKQDLSLIHISPGRGTCANWRTAWSGRSTWPRGNWSPPPSSRRRSGPSRDRRPRRLCLRRRESPPLGARGRTRRRGSRTCSTAPTGTSWRRPACWASAEELYIESSNGITSTTARIGSDIPYDTNETVTQLCAMCGCVTVFVTYVCLLYTSRCV